MRLPDIILCQTQRPKNRRPVRRLVEIQCCIRGHFISDGPGGLSEGILTEPLPLRGVCVDGGAVGGLPKGGDGGLTGGFEAPGEPAVGTVLSRSAGGAVVPGVDQRSAWWRGATRGRLH